jgi:hypothetical protein
MPALRLGLLASAVVLTCSVTASAQRPDSAEAHARYNRGAQLYTDGDYKLALIEFQRSYELSPNWRVLFNIGEVQFQLNNYAAALNTLQRYLSEGGAEVPASKRTQVEKDIETLQSRVAFLTVTTNVPGAEISVDDAPLGTAPLVADRLINAGAHRVSVSAAGYKTGVQNVVLAGRDHQSLKFDLVKDDGGRQVIVVQRTDTSSFNPVWIGWSITGALAVATGVTGGVQLHERSELDTLKRRRDVSRAELDDQQDKVNRLVIATDVLLGATVLAAGISLYFTLKRSGKHDGAAQSAPRLLVGYRSVGLGGSF